MKIKKFFFAPASAEPLAALRVGLCLLLLGQAFTLSRQLLELYGRNGILQGELSDYLASLALPNINWLSWKLSTYGISPDTTLRTMFFIYVGSVASLLIGWQTRVSAVVAWLSHFVVIVSGFVFAYGVDHFANIFLFYLIWMPSGSVFSVDKLLGRETGEPTPGTRLAIRVLQFQLCVVYFSSGIHKAMGAQWWNGEAIWRAVTLPMFAYLDATWLAQVPWLSKVLGWGTIVVEVGYAFFVWPKVTRFAWVCATVGLHLGIAAYLGLVSFGLEMSILTIAMFAFSADRFAIVRLEETALAQ